MVLVPFPFTFMLLDSYEGPLPQTEQISFLVFFFSGGIGVEVVISSWDIPVIVISGMVRLLVLAKEYRLNFPSFWNMVIIASNNFSFTSRLVDCGLVRWNIINGGFTKSCPWNTSAASSWRPTPKRLLWVTSKAGEGSILSRKNTSGAACLVACTSERHTLFCHGLS